MLDAGIGLIEILSRAQGQRMEIDDACRSLNLDRSQLPLIVELLSSLVDTSHGARIALTLDDHEIALLGDAACMSPIRLSFEEGMVLSHVLHELQVDDGLRARAREALLPLGSILPEGDAIGDTAVYGPFHQRLDEAIKMGIRCLIMYRGSNDAEPRERIIDPHRITFSEGKVYLVAWDVDKDDERSYRLDRIESVEMTDDSVERHPHRDEGAALALLKAAAVATVVFRDERTLRQTGWAGMEMGTIRRQGDGFSVDVHVGSEPWLFDQILGSDGAISLIAPASMRERLRDYARSLIP